MIHVSRRQFLGSAALLTIAASAGRAWQPEAKAAALEKRRLGNTDMDVTILGFGGAEIGFQNTEAATIEKLLNSALDAGLNVIDTAECYADSEEEIGRAVGHRRKDYYLFTKVGHAFGRTAEGLRVALSCQRPHSANTGKARWRARSRRCRMLSMTRKSGRGSVSGRHRSLAASSSGAPPAA